MSIRCDFHINGQHRKLVFSPKKEEPHEHVALRLSAFLFFWDYDPKIELSPKHPALAQQEFTPDLIGLTEGGEVALWGECGNTSLNKIDKLTRRYPGARIVVLRASEAEGKKTREDVRERVDRLHRVEIFAWPQEAFGPWSRALSSPMEVFGEASSTSLNLVINHTPIAADLISFPL